MSPDHAVRELTITRPKLRSDLRFVFQDHRGRPSYVLEDLTHRRYFQIGLAEYQFLQALNGKISARDVLAQNARDFGEKALSEQDGTVLLRWLLDQKLLESDSADQSGRQYQHTTEAEDRKPKQAMQKLFFIRMPMGNPDAFLGALLPWLGWTASIPFLTHLDRRHGLRRIFADRELGRICPREHSSYSSWLQLAAPRRHVRLSQTCPRDLARRLDQKIRRCRPRMGEFSS